MTVKGLSKIRVGKECRPYYTAQDDRTRIPVPHVSVEDLSLTSIRWAIAQHHRKFRTSEPRWLEPGDFLAQAHLVEPPPVDEEGRSRCAVPLATLILLGKQATLLEHLPFFETVIIMGSSERRLRKNIVDCIQELCGSERSLVPALCPGVPRTTVQELLVNAYVHRCYRTSAPVVIRAVPPALEIQNPGELIGGLRVDDLIHCVPVYRNLSLADGARFVGLCDKIGRGIDLIYESILSGGMDFPVFESGNNLFTARISLERSREFAEFARRRSQALSSLDEILALRLLSLKDRATLQEVSSVLQRGHAATRRILEEMRKKLMVERSDEDLSFRLAPNLRRDIDTIFESDQMEMDLFGG